MYIEKNMHIMRYMQKLLLHYFLFGVVVLMVVYRRYPLPRDASATSYPSEGCFSDVRGPFRTPHQKKNQKHSSYECSHVWENVWIDFEKDVETYL